MVIALGYGGYAAISGREVKVKQTNKIIAPTDLSKLSRPAVRHALELAMERGAEVIIYHD